ncbi:sushi domain-containing protein 4 isoform X3 [Stegostoma tigrinum]|uniref:sushi domain-containing protein 4 isoform X3 n=1 Tax=Stegostoma tigrinum TaxID=3053191 RepID=UPI00286FC69F|nr:sushi domain-containing protein 4 isoform X3 [Stegostoma tigrinum]
MGSAVVLVIMFSIAGWSRLMLLWSSWTMYDGMPTSSRVSAGTARNLQLAALILCAGTTLRICIANRIPGECPEPTEPQNGYITYPRPRYAENSTIHFFCLRGYFLSGPATLACLRYPNSELDWIPREPPVCNLVVCQVVSVRNGLAENRTYHVDDTLEFHCQTGFHRDPRSTEPLPRCQEDGAWSSVPSCLSNFVTPLSSGDELDSCTDPGFPEHGARTLTPPDAFHQGALVRFHCQDGYKLRGPLKMECQRQEDGSLAWEPSSTPVCLSEFTVCPVPYIEDADVYSNTYRPGDQLTVSCHPGFQIRYPDMENMVTLCQDDGIWDNLPTCQGCLKPQVFPHSYINVSDSVTPFPVGSVLRYQCFPGYKLTGPELLECMYNLLWSSSPPQCLDVEACPLPPIPDHGDYVCHPYPCDRYIHGTVLEFYCDPGYFLTNDYKYITCQYGEWFPRNHVFCQHADPAWSDSDKAVLSTWKIVAFTAISVLLALLLVVFVKAFHIKLKSPCQSGEQDSSAGRHFVVVDGIPVVLPTYDEAVCNSTNSDPVPEVTAPAEQAQQDDQNPPAYPGRPVDRVVAANPTPTERPGQLDCSGPGKWEDSSPSMSFDTAATHPITEDIVDGPETENTASTSPSINIADGIPLLEAESESAAHQPTTQS